MAARRGLWARWTAAFTLGELIGFGCIPVPGAAIALWLTSSLEPSARSLVLYGVAVLGGLGEGAVLGWFQVRVLRGLLPQVAPRLWIGATASAAAVAWALGMLAPTLDDLIGLSTAAQVAIWIPAGIAILLSIGGAQALVLRRIVERPARWVMANAIAWLAGLPWTFLLPALLPEGAATHLWVATFAVAGVLMGATAGAITGFALIRIAAKSAGSPRSVAG